MAPLVTNVTVVWFRASAAMQMRYSLFIDDTQRRLVVTDVSGQPIGLILNGQAVKKNVFFLTAGPFSFRPGYPSGTSCQIPLTEEARWAPDTDLDPEVKSLSLSQDGHRGASSSIPDRSVWDFWWAECLWDSFFFRLRNFNEYPVLIFDPYTIDAM
jgi:hypothetical protein